MPKYVDDKFDHLESDISKIRTRHRQYISYSNEAGAKSVVDEILHNADDECKNPRSPGNKIDVEFDERTGFITVTDNGRGMPTNILEKVFTSLNMGSNIKTSNKASLKAETLGQNGTGTLAICGLAERVEITSYRGGTEDIYKTIIFEEGNKVSEETGSCSKDKHGLVIHYKPSKVMGKNTRIIWKDVFHELENYQYLNKHAIKIRSVYTDAKGNTEETKFKPKSFDEILLRNPEDRIVSARNMITVEDDNIMEELDGETVKRFLSMDVAFVYTTAPNPYIDSFSNSNNTVDNGDHLDGAIEALCRFLQNATKSGMSEKEKESLDIKWDDVKSGMSVAVSLRTNYERMYTGQTKHKIVSPEIKKIVTGLVIDKLTSYFANNQAKLKELCSIVKLNAKIRREGDKVRTAVVKTTLTNWSSYKMPNYSPCTRKGIKEYKELFIIEGDSAKGSLKNSRFPEFQALFAIRGVSMNVFGKSIDQIVGPKGNKEFTDLITVLGCNVGPKFDFNKLQFSKIILASDADVDGLFIRSLLMAFFFKVFPEIIGDGRLFIAEPPLYRVDDKKNPFVINMIDYIDRYAKLASKEYMIGYRIGNKEADYFDKKELIKFLTETSNYVDDMNIFIDHYKVNGTLLEIMLEEVANMDIDMDKFVKIPNLYMKRIMDNIDIQKLNNRIGELFPEIFYDYARNIFKGNINGRYQSIELSPSLIRRCRESIRTISRWGSPVNGSVVLRNARTMTENDMSLLNTLRVLKKYQPTIEHRFKGLSENDPEDMHRTLMDPNSRTLIRVNMGDIENDMKIFQMLRGDTAQDLIARKNMMKTFKIDRNLIDT